MPMSDCIRGAGFYAEPTEDAAIVIDVVNLRVPLTAADADRVCVLPRFDVDTVRRARGRAKKTRHALLESVLIALQYVNTTEALLEFGRLIGIVLRHGGRHHLLQRDAHTLDHCRSGPDYVSDVCHFSFYGSGYTQISVFHNLEKQVQTAFGERLRAQFGVDAEIAL